MKILISGSFELVSSDEKDTYGLLTKNLVELLKNDHTIITGMGRGITDLLTKNDNGYQIKKFQFHSLEGEEKNKFRKHLVNKADVVIYIGGQCVHENCTVNSRGVLKEFDIARSMEKIVIPIGMSGYAANEILHECNKKINEFPYLEQWIEILEIGSVDQVIKVISNILYSVKGVYGNS